MLPIEYQAWKLNNTLSATMQLFDLADVYFLKSDETHKTPTIRVLQLESALAIQIMISSERAAAL